jgi:hypothetical protein
MFLVLILHVLLQLAVAAAGDRGCQCILRPAHSSGAALAAES